MARQQTLTSRELQIMELIADGQTDQQIATHLGIGRRTVSNHVSVILLKLAARRRTQAVTKAMRLGLLPLGAIPMDESILTKDHAPPTIKHYL